MKFQCIKNVYKIKILFKAIYIIIVMGGPAVSHSPGAQWGLNAALLINCLYYIPGPRQSSSLTAPSLASAGLLNVCYYMPAWKNRAAEERRKILLSEVCEADVRANFSCTVPNKMSLCLKTFPLRSCRVCSFLVYTDQGLTLLHLHADMT